MSQARFDKRTIVLAVEGGPEAFVAADMTRRLIREGAKVRVAVTDATCRWLPALTFATLSGASIARSVEEGGALAKDADGVLVMASGTDLVSNLAMRRAVDAAGAAFLCSDAPKVVLPAGCMPKAPWVRALLEGLSEDAVVLAWGEQGEEALAALARALGPRDMVGRRVVVTAGPTREHIDPVRYISNPSSGKMGIALADAARRRGAEVTLLLGPTTSSPPPRVRTLRFETAEELWTLADEAVGAADVFLASAAVGDYAPVSPSTDKIKKGEGELVLRLRRTPDVLGRLGLRYEKDPHRPLLIGFAAETDDLIENARKKLVGKHLDLVVANDVGRPDIGFAGSMNEITLVDHQGAIELPRASKELLAHAVLDRVVSLFSKSGEVGGASSPKNSGVGDMDGADYT